MKFFIEEVFDGLTVPKNLTEKFDLDHIKKVYKDSVNALLNLVRPPTIDLFIKNDDTNTMNRQIANDD